MAGLAELNALPSEEARAALARCCGARAWVEKMAAARPYASEPELHRLAEKTWRGLSQADWLEAFSHHPKIGDKSVLRQKFAATAQWARYEQAGVGAANDQILDALAAGNQEYEEKFGYLFIVCATGKSAAEMLALLQARLKNDRQSELIIAAEEQLKIMRLRLEKLVKGI